MPDPYKVLEVARSATSEDIKLAYRKLALHYHPDKNHGDVAKAEETFKVIATAYSILGDPDKRRRFDHGGFDSLNPNDFEVDVSELGKVDTVMMAMFSKLGVPVKTAVSKQVMQALDNGWYQTQRLALGASCSGKVRFPHR
jgi:curved DNA-binding protein CbpA